MKKILIISFIPIILYSLELKIASYNVENLFDNVYNGSEYKEYIPNSHNWTEAILKKKLLHITQVICELNPDIIGLQEIENKNALKLLQKSLKRHGCNYPYSAITNKKGSSIEVALLSKVNLIQKKDILVSYSPRDRNILEVELQTKPKLTIFVNHWRSKAAKESERIKYAKALIKRIKKMPKGKEYIILGDFNSAYNECSKGDKKKICAIDTILHTTINGKLIRFRDKIASNNIFHYNSSSFIYI